MDSNATRLTGTVGTAAGSVGGYHRKPTVSLVSHFSGSISGSIRHSSDNALRVVDAIRDWGGRCRRLPGAGDAWRRGASARALGAAVGRSRWAAGWPGSRGVTLNLQIIATSIVHWLSSLLPYPTAISLRPVPAARTDWPGQQPWWNIGASFRSYWVIFAVFSYALFFKEVNHRARFLNHKTSDSLIVTSKRK